MKKFKKLSTLLEVSNNNTPNFETFKKYVDFISAMGYDELYLSLTDAYKMEGEPYFNYKRGGFTTDDFKKMEEYANAKGLDLIPNIQTLGHLAYLERHFCYTDMLDTREILLVGNERVYELVDKMFKTMAGALKSRRIHIGYDETYGLGTGNYFKQNGFRDRKEILLEHLKRVVEIGEKYGYTFEIWHDMLIERFQTNVTPEVVKAALPDSVKVFYWNYREANEETLRKNLAELKENVGSYKKITYTGAAYKINGLSTQNDFSISRIIPQMKVSAELGIEQYLVTVWSDRGAWVNNFAVMPVLFAAAEYANGNFDENKPLDKQKFFDIVGVKFDDFMSLDYLNNPDKQPSKYVHNRSFRVFVEDMLVTGYDLLHDMKMSEWYETLADEYSRVEAGEFGYIFEMAAAFARTLSIRANLGRTIRAAYKNADKQALAECLSRLENLNDSLAELIDIFYDYWRKTNMGFGSEINHLFLGGQLVRNDYIMRVIRDYIENDRKIDELETETIPPSIDPQYDDDTLFVYDFPWLLTNSNLQ